MMQQPNSRNPKQYIQMRVPASNGRCNLGKNIAGRSMLGAQHNPEKLPKAENRFNR